MGLRQEGRDSSHGRAYEVSSIPGPWIYTSEYYLPVIDIIMIQTWPQFDLDFYMFVGRDSQNTALWKLTAGVRNRKASKTRSTFTISCGRGRLLDRPVKYSSSDRPASWTPNTHDACQPLCISMGISLLISFIRQEKRPSRAAPRR